MLQTEASLTLFYDYMAKILPKKAIFTSYLQKQSHKLKNIALIINTLEDMAYKSLILIICALMVPTMEAWAADEVAAAYSVVCVSDSVALTAVVSRREAAVRHGHQH